VSEELQKRITGLVKEKASYGMALAVIAAVLIAIGFPAYLLVFFGVFTFFVWKAFAHTERNEIRGIFEFYLAANEMLRDDEKRWFGFEMQEVLHAGERILNAMPDPPPLMLFTLGALHHKIGNYEIAAQYLGAVLENEQMDEKRRLIASPELKSYVKVLRKIERDPVEAPQTSAAIRALERARRNRAAVMLEESQQKIAAIKAGRLKETADEYPAILDLTTSAVDADTAYVSQWNMSARDEENPAAANGSGRSVVEDIKAGGTENSREPASANKEANGRKPITEVLKDIYDR
jgi:hypothetical protein